MGMVLTVCTLDEHRKKRSTRKTVLLRRSMGLKFAQNHAPQLRNAPRTQGQHHIAGLSQRRHHPDRIRERSSMRDAHILSRSNAPNQSLRRNPFDRLLVRRINIKQAKRVRVAKSVGKVVHQIARPGKSMRLKDHMHPAKSTLPSRRQGRPNLRWMMPIIVDHTYATRVSLDLKTPVHSAKSIQARAYLVRRNIQRG